LAAAFTIEFHFGLRAGTVQVDIGPEVLLVEPVEGRGVLMGNVPVTDMFADHHAVLGLQQPVAVPGPGLGLFDQQLGHRMIDKLATISEGKPRRWKGNWPGLLQYRQQPRRPDLRGEPIACHCVTSSTVLIECTFLMPSRSP
jgi:hypothetical protein